MARIRSIKPQFFLNDELATLDPLDRILFIGLWTIADREGRLEDRPAKIKAAILPYDDYGVEPALRRLAESGFIIRYSFEDGGKRYIQITNFSKHQCPNPKELPSTIPAPIQNSTGAQQGTLPVTCQHSAGTLRLGKGREGKGESEYLKPSAPKPPLPIARPCTPEKAASSGKPIPPDGPKNSRDQPVRAGPMAANATGRENGKYDGIAENV